MEVPSGKAQAEVSSCVLPNAGISLHCKPSILAASVGRGLSSWGPFLTGFKHVRPQVPTELPVQMGECITHRPPPRSTLPNWGWFALSSLKPFHWDHLSGLNPFLDGIKGKPIRSHPFGFVLVLPGHHPADVDARLRAKRDMPCPCRVP